MSALNQSGQLFLKNETIKPDYGSESIERPLVFTNLNNKKLRLIFKDIN